MKLLLRRRPAREGLRRVRPSVLRVLGAGALRVPENLRRGGDGAPTQRRDLQLAAQFGDEENVSRVVAV